MLALRFAEKLKTQKDSVITVRLHQDSDIRRATIGRFRIALSDAEYSWPSFEKRGEEGRRFDQHRVADAIVKALEPKKDEAAPKDEKAVKEAEKRAEQRKEALENSLNL